MGTGERRPRLRGGVPACEYRQTFSQQRKPPDASASGGATCLSEDPVPGPATGFLPLHERLRRRAERDPEGILFVHGGSGMTSRRVLALVEAAASGLAARGVGRGDRVAFTADRSPAAVVLTLAASSLGAVAVPLDADLGSFERASIFDHARPALVVDGDGGDGIPRANFADLAGSSPGTPAGAARPRPGDPLLILYTSAARSRTRGITLTHRNVTAGAVTAARLLGLRRRRRILAILPAAHVGQIVTTAFGALVSGATAVLAHDPAPDETLRIVARERVAVLLGPLQAIYLVLNDPDRPEQDLRSLARIVILGSTCPVALGREIRGTLGASVATAFALEETAGIFAGTRGDDDPGILAGSWGRGAPALALRAPGPSPSGTPGEIEIRGSAVMAGCWNDSDATREFLMDPPWLRTGLLGTVGEDGILRVAGRIRDVVERNGLLIDTAEIEDVLGGHELIREVAVVGLPDDTLGEIVCACVVPVAGAGDLTPSAVRSLCARELAPRKIPDIIVALDQLPRTPEGRIRKDLLRGFLLGQD